MCGRTCLSLAPNEVRKNCAYCSQSDPKAKKEPEWTNQYNFGKEYKPSFNIAPTDVTPVLISKSHLTEDENDSGERVLVPMMWGIVPHFHKGDYKKHGFHTNNARLEGLLENRVFKDAFKKGQRCVVLAEGFYEWQTTTKDKKPYYVFAKQNSDQIQIEDKSTWPLVEDLNLLKMAGIFDIWTDENGDKIWAYTVLTRESNDVLSWMHHRTPVFLETEQEIENWLDFQTFPAEVALSQLKPVKLLMWHEVSSMVNNSRNKSEQCNKKVVKKEESKKGKITTFFQKKPRKAEDEDIKPEVLKKPKLE